MFTPNDRLSLEPINSPLKRSLGLQSSVVDSKEDEELTCLDEIGGGRREEFNTIITLSSMEEEPKPNLDKVMDNIQIE